MSSRFFSGTAPHRPRRANLWLSLVACSLTCWVGQAQAAISDATFSDLFHFDLSYSLAGVTQGLGSDSSRLFGSTYNVAKSSGGTLFSVARDGGAPQVIYQLTTADGYSPRAALLASADGFLYGTTHNSKPTTTKLQSGGGTVFRVRPDGTQFATLHDFATDSFGAATINPSVDDSIAPDFTLLEIGSYLYGVTARGGANGTGMVYRLLKDGTGALEVLHSFAAADTTASTLFSSNADGALPSAPLTLGSDGRLYGVTRFGGANKVSSVSTAVDISGAGTIYSLAQDGSGFTSHYSFPALDTSATPAVNTTGANPASAVVEISPGVFVGTATVGGDPGSSTSGYGTVYQFTASTNDVQALHAFNNSDGATPAGNLVYVAPFLYGTTTSGLSTASPATTYGALYRLDLTTPATPVFSNLFAYYFGGGIGVTGGLLLGSDANLYGVTTAGGDCNARVANGFGVVFRYGSGGVSGYSNCTPAVTSGGGSMQSVWLLILAGVALVGATWRRRRRAVDQFRNCHS